jgi:diguanylate cyclase (GGDEF)-like protein
MAQSAATDQRLDADFAQKGLDALGDVVRACGEHAFDTARHTGETMRAQAEQWVRHLLLGAAHPQNHSVKGRDFVGVRRFVRELRAAEAEYVRSALGEFRSIISAVFRNIERALVVDGEADANMRIQLDRLHKALQSSSLDQVRKEVAAVSDELTSALTKRDQRRDQQLASLGAELRQLNVRLDETRRTAATDALTGVHNRRAFDAFLDRVVEFDGVTGTPAALLMIDVDNFKKLNDEHGHPVGDAALATIGRALSRTFLRKCDFVARYGGEEFAVVVRDAGPGEARKLGERARAAIEALKVPDKPELSLSASVGVATLVSLEDRSTWLKRADDALLSAKRAGKNCCIVAG